MWPKPSFFYSVAKKINCQCFPNCLHRQLEGFQGFLLFKSFYQPSLKFCEALLISQKDLYLEQPVPSVITKLCVSLHWDFTEAPIHRVKAPNLSPQWPQFYTNTLCLPTNHTWFFPFTIFSKSQKPVLDIWSVNLHLPILRGPEENEECCNMRHSSLTWVWKRSLALSKPPVKMNKFNKTLSLLMAWKAKHFIPKVFSALICFPRSISNSVI